MESRSKNEDSFNEEKIDEDHVVENKDTKINDKETRKVLKKEAIKTIIKGDENGNPLTNMVHNTGTPIEEIKKKSIEAEIKKAEENVETANVVKKGKKKNSKSKKSKNKENTADKIVVKAEETLNEVAVEEANVNVGKTNKKKRQRSKKVAKRVDFIVVKDNCTQTNDEDMEIGEVVKNDKIEKSNNKNDRNEPEEIFANKINDECNKKKEILKDCDNNAVKEADLKIFASETNTECVKNNKIISEDALIYEIRECDKVNCEQEKIKISAEETDDVFVKNDNIIFKGEEKQKIKDCDHEATKISADETTDECVENNKIIIGGKKMQEMKDCTKVDEEANVVCVKNDKIFTDQDEKNIENYNQENCEQENEEIVGDKTNSECVTNYKTVTELKQDNEIITDCVQQSEKEISKKNNNECVQNDTAVAESKQMSDCDLKKEKTNSEKTIVITTNKDIFEDEQEKKMKKCVQGKEQTNAEGNVVDDTQKKEIIKDCNDICEEEYIKDNEIAIKGEDNIIILEQENEKYNPKETNSKNDKNDKIINESEQENKIVATETVDADAVEFNTEKDNEQKEGKQQKGITDTAHVIDNKRKSRKQKNKYMGGVDKIKEEEKENLKLENVAIKENKKKKRKESTYIVETDELFEIKENKNKKRKQKNGGALFAKENKTLRNDNEESAVSFVRENEKKKRKSLKDYIREKKSKSCTITTAVVKRLTPEEVAMFTGVFPMDEPDEEPSISEAMESAGEYPPSMSPYNERNPLEEPIIAEPISVGPNEEKPGPSGVQGACALEPEPAENQVEPSKRKDVLLDILLEDLHEKTANLAPGEHVVLFRSILPKADIVCLQALKDKVSDADFLWANYYFTLKHVMDKKYSFLKGVLIPDEVTDKKYEPPPRNPIYTEKAHVFDIVVEK